MSYELANRSEPFCQSKPNLERVSDVDRNVGGLDRTGRIVVGLVAVIAGIVALSGYWAVGIAVGIVALVVGAVLLVTGTTQKCPINEAVGVDTTE